MNYAKIFTLSSALIVAASVFGASAEARKSNWDQCTANHLTKAECACVMALEKGTEMALRDYLRLYRTADTACNARASTATTEISNEGEPDSGTTPGSSTTVASTKNNNGLGNGDEGDWQGSGGFDAGNPGHNDSGGNDSGGNGGNGNGNGNGGKP
jgi:hypothetical protein